MEDAKIIDLYFARSEDAICQTDAAYGRKLFCLADRILQDAQDSEEAVSDTYLALWDAIPPHKPMILRTFLGKIARRTALKQWEKSRTQKRGGGEVALALEELSEYLTDGYTPETAIEMAELTQILNGFLQNLPKEERQVFVCRYWYLDPIADIAQRFSFTQSKVKSMLARTRMKLRATLTKEGITL